MVSAILVAAGRGARMGASVNKLLLKIGERYIIEYTIEAFEKCKDIDEIILVINPDDEAVFAEIAKKYSNTHLVYGGKTRQESVLRGLRAARGEYVAIHDGARALITPELITKVVEDGKKYKAAILGVKSTDTVKITDANGMIISTTDRERTYRAQTPQVFERKKIIFAHENAAGSVTDDASLFEKLDMRVKMTEGSYENIKLTTPEDLIFAENLLKERAGKE